MKEEDVEHAEERLKKRRRRRRRRKEVVVCRLTGGDFDLASSRHARQGSTSYARRAREILFPTRKINSMFVDNHMQEIKSSVYELTVSSKRTMNSFLNYFIRFSGNDYFILSTQCDFFSLKTLHIASNQGSTLRISLEIQRRTGEYRQPRKPPKSGSVAFTLPTLLKLFPYSQA